MTDRPPTVLVISSTGSIGRLVVEEAVLAGYHVRALMDGGVTAAYWYGELAPVQK